MAATISATPDSVTVRMTFQSLTGDEATKTFELDGGVTDTELQHLFDDIDALTNAKIIASSVSSVRQVTGLKSSPVSALQSLVSNIMFLTFTKANPLNAAKLVKKTFSIPAFVDATVRDDGDNSIVVAAAGTGSLPARIGRIIELLDADLEYVGADGAFYPGGWDYQSAQSGFGTVNDVIDGN